MTRWEYAVFQAVHDVAALNALGREGWELVTVYGSSQQAQGVAMVFKRPVGDVAAVQAAAE